MRSRKTTYWTTKRSVKTIPRKKPNGSHRLAKTDIPLVERERLLQTIIDTEPECVKLIAVDGTLLQMNPAGLAMIEADSLDQVLGKSVFPLVASEYQEAFKTVTEEVFRGRPGVLEFEIIGLKGTRRWLETHAVPLRNRAGKVISLLSITRDITDSKRTEERTKTQALALERANSQLEKANSVKNQFLSVMSHELRTPLNVVMGYAGMLQEGILGGINAEQEKALGKIINRSNELLSMISSILAASRMESEEVHVGNHRIDLCSFLDDLKLANDSPLDKELLLVWNYPKDLPAIKTDSGKLKHILQNLINNAVKFTEKGSVTISASRLSALDAAQADPELVEGSPQPSNRWVEFKVADTGIGISADALPYIFERFHQVDSSETRAYGGVGIGLYTAKKFTELLGGTIEAESEPGKGSTFTVTLPVEQ